MSVKKQPSFILALRSGFFWIGFALSTVFIATIALLTFFLPFKYRYWLISSWTYFNLWWLKISCGIKVNIVGQENITVDNGIVFSKHQSTWETLALKILFNPETWVLKKELLSVPFFGWAARLVEPIALDRKARRKAVDQLIEQGRDRLEKGRWVIIFPEGTRIPPGQKGKYKIGGAALASATGFPVIPVAHNAGEYWPRHGFIKYPGTIQLRIGKPIGSADKTAQEIMQLAESWIETQMDSITHSFLN
ncbi:MAG: lysophospholipid acyltransferase family protein [Methylococcaceae bacterium]